MTDSDEGSPLAFEVPALSPPLQSQVVHARDQYERGLRDIIAEGVQRGEIRAVDPKIAVFVILGALNWIARWYQPKGTVDSRRPGPAIRRSTSWRTGMPTATVTRQFGTRAADTFAFEGHPVPQGRRGGPHHDQ